MHKEGPTASATGTDLEEADIAVAEQLGAHRHHPAIRALGFMSEIADQVPAFTLCGAVLAGGLVARQPKVVEAGARMLASALVATAIKSAVKGLVSRTRPNVLLEEGIYAVEPLGPDDGSWHSFPSGHTADATAMARALVRVYPDAALPAYGAALAIGAVQVPRGAHYPIDVAAGVGVGAVAELIVNQAAEIAAATLARTGVPPESRPAPRGSGRSRGPRRGSSGETAVRKPAAAAP